MNFGKTDLTILVVMTLAIVVMSFTFPALGLTEEGDTVNGSDIPSFSMDTDRFDIAGEFPTRPGTPSSGVLRYNTEIGNSVDGITLEWVDTPKDTGYVVEIQNTSQWGFDAVVTNFTSTGSTAYRYNLTSEGQTVLHQEGEWTIEFTVEQLENLGQSNMTAQVAWEIHQSPEDEGTLASIPIVGGLADELAGILGFLALVINWGVMFTFEIALNTINALFAVTQYGFGMFSFLTTTYTSVISAAPGWASVVLSIPGVILAGEFAKIAMIGIKLLPTT